VSQRERGGSGERKPGCPDLCRLRVADRRLRVRTVQHPAQQSFLHTANTLLVELRRLRAHALALFAALSILLQAATWRTALLGRSDEPSLPAPLIATLAMTTLLPSIPLLKRVDEWFLSIFLEWAEIPAEIKRRAAAMTRRASVSAERMWPSCAKPMATAAMATDMVVSGTKRR
jgi:hypothetical protein